MMFVIRVKMANGVDEYSTPSVREANRIIRTALGFGKLVIAFRDGNKIFDNVNRLLIAE